MVEMIPVESSNIKEIGYDPPTERLRVTFKTDKTYEYFGVSDVMWQAFQAADSKGKFFHKHIREEYVGKKV